MTTHARKVGILGAGYIADFHLRALLSIQGVTIEAVCDADSLKAERLQRQWNIPKAFSSLDAMLSGSEIEVIHILLPPAMHASAAVQCLENGRHVFIEKPLACSAIEAMEIQKVGRRFGRAIGVNHNNTCHPAFLRLVSAIQEWRLGELEHVTVCVNVPLRQLSAGQHSHWMFRSPGNIVFEQAPHPLSQICFLLGPVNKASSLVSGEVTLNSGQPFYASWQSSLLCERGSAQLFMGFGKEYFDFWLHAVGQDGAAFVDLRRSTFRLNEKTRFMDPVDNLVDAFRNSSRIAGQNIANFTDYVRGFLKLRAAADPFSTGMRLSITRFYEDLASGSSPREGIEQGLAIVEACDAIIEGVDGARVGVPGSQEVAANG